MITPQIIYMANYTFINLFQDRVMSLILGHFPRVKAPMLCLRILFLLFCFSYFKSIKIGPSK